MTEIPGHLSRVHKVFAKMLLLFFFASGVAASKLTSYEMKLDELPVRKHSNGGKLVHPSEDALMVNTLLASLQIAS